MTDITIEKAKEKLGELRETGEKLLDDFDQQEFRKWKRSVKAAVANIFGEDSRHLEEIENIRFSPTAWTVGPSGDRAIRRARNSGIKQTIAFIESMEEEIENYWHEEPESEATVGKDTSDAASSEGEPRVFIVHGHDSGAKEAVARFISKLDLKPVILHEQPNEGRSLLRKIEDESNSIGFAVVILTPDDECCVTEGEEEGELRARQNVVFELGFFTAALGRERVAALKHEKVVIPSDYDGIGYIPFDQEERRWRMELINELKAAGLEVDANKAFEA